MAANLSLSRQRAEAVVACLVNRHHVDPAHLQTQGVGPLAPMASNRYEEGRAKNRSVELGEQ